MRKLHLLQAESREREKTADWRTYRVMQCWMSGDNVPTAEELFPSLAGMNVEKPEGMLDDAETIFSQVDSATKSIK